MKERGSDLVLVKFIDFGNILTLAILSLFPTEAKISNFSRFRLLKYTHYKTKQKTFAHFS